MYCLKLLKLNSYYTFNAMNTNQLVSLTCERRHRVAKFYGGHEKHKFHLQISIS